jgi:predicted RNase H-like nuclease
MSDGVAGVDGCPAGWVVAFLDAGGECRVAVVERFAEVFAGAPPAVVAVDMPIGLPERVGPGGRGPEAAVRPLLGSRQSSVFSVPSRAAVEAVNEPYLSMDQLKAFHQRACVVARATSDPPKGVAIQTFCLFPKIRELDGFLRGAPELSRHVFEVHPEVAFWRLNGERALTEPKKVKGRPHGPGVAQRCDLLMAAGIAPEVIDQGPPSGAAIDDLLDALACALTARRIRAGEARPFPDPPGRDVFGLAMAIWA